MPVPLRSTVGEPVEFDVSVNVAERRPAAAGVNLGLIVQLAPAASAPPTGQLFVCENSMALVPVKLTMPKVSGALPVLDKLMARGALGVLRVTAPKSTATGARVATGTNGVGAVPVPETPTVWGLPAAVEVTVTTPVDAAADDGKKVTLIVQLEAAASVAAQLCPDVNPLPVVTIEAMPSAAPPELVSEIGLVTLVPTV